jgi:glycosyltransferase involved in cell wall biosynthesis
VFTVTQSVDVQHFSEAMAVPQPDRDALRKRFGLRGCVFIYVGRLWERKGLDFLFDAYRQLHREREGTSLLVVGDGHDEKKYRELFADDPSVLFTGFVQKDHLPRYYAMADVFVFPTLGDPHGLVIDEAMAAGLPVISTSAAGDVLKRVPEGQAGFVVRPADANALRNRMRYLVDNSDERMEMSRTAAELSVQRAPENYAEDFENFVFSVLNMPARRNFYASASRMAGKAIYSVLRAR